MTRIGSSSSFLRPRTCIAVLCAAAVGGGLVVPAQASEGTAGRLKLAQVLHNHIDGVEGLFAPRMAAVSPDGAHVYVISALGDSLAVFSRDPENGRLAFVEVHRDGVDGLADA